MAIGAAVGLAARIAKKKKFLRDRSGKFRAATVKDVASGGAIGGYVGERYAEYMEMGGHPACGKKQYKSAECKARAIQARIEETGEASPNQIRHLRRFWESGD